MNSDRVFKPPQIDFQPSAVDQVTLLAAYDGLYKVANGVVVQVRRILIISLIGKSWSVRWRHFSAGVGFDIYIVVDPRAA